MVIANFLTGCLLMQSFVGYLDMRRLQRWLQIAAAVFVVLMVLFFVGDRTLIMKITTGFGAFVSFTHLAILFYLCFRFLNNKVIPLGSRLFGFFLVSLLAAIVCRSMLQALKVIEEGSFLLQSPAWRGALFTLMLFSFLWYRENVRNRTLGQNQIDIAIAEAQVKEKNLRMETQSQFMAMLMHELKTPLYIIQVATISLSRHMAASNPDTKRLDNISRAADDINFIIDRCVQADRLDQNDLQVHKTPVALKTLLSEVTHIKGNERVTLSGIDQAMVVTDYQLSRIILINLVTNALKYSPPGSPVQLTVQETPLMAGHGLTLRVSNAVASAGRPDPLKVFTRYFRAEGAKKEVGAGLGLWLAHSLAIKLGHELRCSSDDESVHFDFSLELS
jgi:signal transduction histidine kinase